MLVPLIMENPRPLSVPGAKRNKLLIKTNTIQCVTASLTNWKDGSEVPNKYHDIFLAPYESIVTEDTI